jgi:hypothetical protein
MEFALCERVVHLDRKRLLRRLGPLLQAIEAAMTRGDVAAARALVGDLRRAMLLA